MGSDTMRFSVPFFFLFCFVLFCFFSHIVLDTDESKLDGLCFDWLGESEYLKSALRFEKAPSNGDSRPLQASGGAAHVASDMIVGWLDG